MTTYLQVITTVDSREGAARIAETLVRQRLAGCVQIVGPISSTYWWNGEIETADEWLCLIKTEAERYGAVEEAIRAVHPYDVPEVLAMPVAAGSAGYLAWLSEQVRPAR